MSRSPFFVGLADDGRHQVRALQLTVKVFEDRADAEALCDSLTAAFGITKPARRVRHAFSSCEHFPGSEYTDEERGFLIAIDKYKRETGNMFPTWIQILDLLRELGWHKDTLAK